MNCSTLPSLSTLCDVCKVLEIHDIQLLLSNLKPSTLTQSDEPGEEWIYDLDWDLKRIWPHNLSETVKCDCCKFFSDLLWLARWPYYLWSDTAKPTLHYVFKRQDNANMKLCYLRLRALDDEWFFPDNLLMKCRRGEEFIFDLPIHSAAEIPQELPIALNEYRNHLDPESTKWMTSMIDSCSSHGHEMSYPELLPDRLIRVEENKIYLILTKDIETSTLLGTLVKNEANPEVNQNTGLLQYSALTYCWGAPPHADRQLKTTTQNITQHCKSIPEHELPQAVKEAVSVTRALKIPYLWIDALCIIQDQTSDWEDQCKRMVQIYGNATVTLVAATSKNCEEGFVDGLLRLVLPIYYSAEDNTVLSRFAVFNPSLISVTGEIKASEWGKRGWTYQERLASTRMIVFGGYNVYFCCQKESCPMGQDPLKKVQFLDRDLLKESSDDIIYGEWRRLVSYDHIGGAPGFARPTDILPSIAGIASLFGSRLNDRYIAGFWEKDLYRSLAWRCYFSPGEPPRFDVMLQKLRHPTQYISPSWSWARYPGTAGFIRGLSPEVTYCSKCNITEANVTLKGGSAFGEITEGYVRISSKIYADPSPYVANQEYKNGEMYFRFDLLLDGVYFTTVWPDFAAGDLLNQEDDFFRWKRAISFLLLGILEDGEAKQPDTSPNRCYGLLIYPAGDSGSYYRVGCFWSTQDEASTFKTFERCVTREIRLI